MQQDVRYRRAGGDQQPYRDDPNAPVQLESFVRAGYGNATPSITDEWKKHQATTLQSSSSSPLHFLSSLDCCIPTNPALEDEGPNGRYYRDNFNEYSRTCSFGTSDEDGIWLNQSDPAGTIMAMMVWILLGYSCLTVTLMAQTGGIPPYQSFIYTALVVMALACHIKTSLTDPGSVPSAAVPTEAQRKKRSVVHVLSVPNFQASFVTPLPNLQSLHQSHGPSLSMDEQLCWSRQLEAFLFIFAVYLELQRLLLGTDGLQLLLLLQ